MRKGLWQPQEVQRERRGGKRTNETPQGAWLGRRGKIASGSATQGLWLGDRKSGISGNGRRRKPTPWGKNSWESYERTKMKKKSQQQNEGESTQI